MLKNVASALVLSTVLLGTALTTPSWSMDTPDDSSEEDCRNCTLCLAGVSPSDSPSNAEEEIAFVDAFSSKFINRFTELTQYVEQNKISSSKELENIFGGLTKNALGNNLGSNGSQHWGDELWQTFFTRQHSNGKVLWECFIDILRLQPTPEHIYYNNDFTNSIPIKISFATNNDLPGGILGWYVSPKVTEESWRAGLEAVANMRQ